jgi:hypothetical protein
MIRNIGLLLYIKKTTAGNVSTPEWYTAVKGENKTTGYGFVLMDKWLCM